MSTLIARGAQYAASPAAPRRPHFGLPAFTPRPPIPRGPFLVVGLGRAGQAAVQALSKRQAAAPQQIFAWDSDTNRQMRRLASRLERAGVSTWLGDPPNLGTDVRARTVVKSPGISFDVPLLEQARELGLEVLDELELGWRLSRAPMLAVTGTNGKSTVAGLAAAITAAAGCRVSLAGNTEFGAPLSAAALEPLDLIVCETSSFQLDGCEHLLPEIAIFTNLTADHMGRHRTIARYGEAKRRLFVRGGSVVPQAIVDIDDPFGCRLAADLQELGGAVTRVGFSAQADYRVESAEWDLRSAEARLRTPSGLLTARTCLPGAYNARNVAAALALADLLEVDREIAAAALRAFSGTPGRFEHIDAGQPFDVIVDFAHNPDALEQLLRTVRASMRPRSRLIVVLGRGGAPGIGLRELGRIARQLSDRLILSKSGFRGSPPLLALRSTLGGARSASGGELELVLDKRRVIERGLGSARPGDVVVIPGRGALPAMTPDPRGPPTAFDDREVTLQLLREMAPANERSGPRR